MAVTTYWLERAWTGSDLLDGLRVQIEGGRFTDVSPGPANGAERLAGLTIPGFANCHSHAFHRALRGRTHTGRGTFWTWREQMYAVAERLDPESYHELALATFREMVSVGITSVGEFHYLHHGPGGTPYDEPNEMGLALVRAARTAGLRIALLDTCYLAAGFDRSLAGVQLRFGDRDAATWQQRVDQLAAAVPGAGSGDDGVVVGAAIHSVRAVPRKQMGPVVDWTGSGARPLHVHLSEQVAENDACRAAYGLSPTEVLADAGVLGEHTSAVHATHLGAHDIALLGTSGTVSCFCPTTERDLGDGIGPSRLLHAAGSPLTLGSDSHAVVDPFEEMRAVELDERLATQERGHWAADELLVAATGTGHRSLGFPDAGRIEVGARADLVTLETTSPRTAGTGAGLGTAVFAATGADVLQVVADGRVVFRAEERRDVGRQLERAIAAVWDS